MGFGVVRRLGLTGTAWTEQLQKSGLAVSADGTRVTSAEEAHRVAATVVYNIPANRILAQEYVDAGVPALKLQFLRGGVRLAGLLNAIFDGSATTVPPTADSEGERFNGTWLPNVYLELRNVGDVMNPIEGYYDPPRATPRRGESVWLAPCSEEP